MTNMSGPNARTALGNLIQGRAYPPVKHSKPCNFTRSSSDHSVEVQQPQDFKAPAPASLALNTTGGRRVGLAMNTAVKKVKQDEVEAKSTAAPEPATSEAEDEDEEVGEDSADDADGDNEAEAFDAADYANGVTEDDAFFGTSALDKAMEAAKGSKLTRAEEALIIETSVWSTEVFGNADNYPVSGGIADGIALLDPDDYPLDTANYLVRDRTIVPVINLDAGDKDGDGDEDVVMVDDDSKVNETRSFVPSKEPRVWPHSRIYKPAPVTKTAGSRRPIKRRTRATSEDEHDGDFNGELEAPAAKKRRSGRTQAPAGSEALMLDDEVDEVDDEDEEDDDGAALGQGAEDGAFRQLRP